MAEQCLDDMNRGMLFGYSEANTCRQSCGSNADAGYFARNLRAIEVLVDQDEVRSGRAASESWKFYDLGHGYCTYDFFEQCQHRMTCAKCDFYMPKQSTQHCCWRARSICCDCSWRFLSAKRSRHPLKMASQLMNFWIKVSRCHKGFVAGCPTLAHNNS